MDVLTNAGSKVNILLPECWTGFFRLKKFITFCGCITLFDVIHLKSMLCRSGVLVVLGMESCVCVRAPVIRFNERVYIPQEDHPEIGFIGMIIGPRGNSLRKIEKDVRFYFRYIGLFLFFCLCYVYYEYALVLFSFTEKLKMIMHA